MQRIQRILLNISYLVGRWLAEFAENREALVDIIANFIAGWDTGKSLNVTAHHPV